jgi:signal peptidase
MAKPGDRLAADRAELEANRPADLAADRAEIIEPSIDGLTVYREPPGKLSAGVASATLPQADWAEPHVDAEVASAATGVANAAHADALRAELDTRAALSLPVPGPANPLSQPDRPPSLGEAAGALLAAVLVRARRSARAAMPASGATTTSGGSSGSYHPGRPSPGQIATGSLVALLFALALLLTPITQVFGGLQLLAVMSGSMEPSIPVGGIVGIRPVPATNLKVGDVITFVSQTNSDVLITHRVVSVEVRDGQTQLTTKGDANNSVDALSAPTSRAVGRVEFALPWLGYLLVWLGSPMAKIGIVALAVLALGLNSVQRSSPRATPRRVADSRVD